MENRRTLHATTLMHKIIKRKAPVYLCSKIRYRHVFHRHNTRGKEKIHIPNYRNVYGRDRYFRKITNSYNNLMDIPGFTSNLTVNGFKSKLKKRLLDGQ